MLLMAQSLVQVGRPAAACHVCHERSYSNPDYNHLIKVVLDYGYYMRCMS